MRVGRVASPLLPSSVPRVSHAHTRARARASPHAQVPSRWLARTHGGAVAAVAPHQRLRRTSIRTRVRARNGHSSRTRLAATRPPQPEHLNPVPRNIHIHLTYTHTHTSTHPLARANILSSGAPPSSNRTPREHSDTTTPQTDTRSPSKCTYLPTADTIRRIGIAAAEGNCHVCHVCAMDFVIN